MITQPLTRSITTHSLLWLVALSLLTILTYIRGITHWFVAEDYYQLGMLGQSFDQVWQVYLESMNRLWVLTMLYRWTTVQLFGANPIGYLLLSLLLHVSVVLLVYYFTNSLIQNRYLALSSAAVFALYPRHHEAIISVAAAPYLIAAFFSLLCVYAFSRYLNSKKLRWYILALLSFAFALMSLELPIVVFPLLIVIEIFFVRHNASRNLKFLFDPYFYTKYLPFLAVAILFTWFTFDGSGSSILAGDMQTFSYQLVTPALHSIRDFGAYLIYTIYPFIPLRSLGAGPLAVAITAVTGAALLVMLIRGSSVIRFAIIWIILTVLPFIFFSPFGNTSRYFYLTGFGFALLVSAVGQRIYEQGIRLNRINLARNVLVVCILLYGTASVIVVQQRVDEWHRAGETARGIVEQIVTFYPSPAPDSVMLLVELPAHHGQAYVFSNGGGAAVSFAYRDRIPGLQVYQTNHPEVGEYVANAQPVNAPLPDLYIFCYREDALQDKTGTVDDIDVLHPNTWF